jgi:hypothetical protein
MTFAVWLSEKIYQSNSQLLSHLRFVLSWKARKRQHALASSSLGVSRELHLTLFLQGEPRSGLVSQN